ncbi:unnamed protein product [Protopolystoma xenopodis]|uniref:Exportin-7/Ran-binding protein 17 TPR repeats domain-containing protein n=1 Tax=Protopolystoma xenopodis TaxID=117903 RepID=A0A3S5B426_9PLAT|nr:unnamed protein product [Protopolystoma xenopodis]
MHWSPQFSVIGRCDYPKTCELLVQLFDLSATSLETGLAHVSATPAGSVDPAVHTAIRIEQLRLAWLVHMIGR